MLSRQDIIDILKEGNGVSFSEISTPKLLFDVLKFGGFSGILLNPIDECYYKLDVFNPSILEKYLIDFRCKSKLHRGESINIFYSYTEDGNKAIEFKSKGYDKVNNPLGYILNGWDSIDELFGKVILGFGIITYNNFIEV